LFEFRRLTKQKRGLRRGEPKEKRPAERRESWRLDLLAEVRSMEVLCELEEDSNIELNQVVRYQIRCEDILGIH
jgi:hypothetical protein